MNEIIKIEGREVAGTITQTVNARELWQFVESKQEFSNWIKARIEKYGFVEGEDFTVDKKITQYNQIDRIDYHLTLEAGKELAMVENNEKGRQVRRYFIECEKRAKETLPVDPLKILNDPSAMRGLLLTYSEKVLALQDQVAVQAPKVHAFQRIAGADGGMCFTDAAKTLQMRPKDLLDWLSANKWIYKRPGNASWIGYQNRLQSNLIEHKTLTIERPDGTAKVVTQALVTPKGLSELALAFKEAA